MASDMLLEVVTLALTLAYTKMGGLCKRSFIKNIHLFSKKYDKHDGLLET